MFFQMNTSQLSGMIVAYISHFGNIKIIIEYVLAAYKSEILAFL